MNVRYCSLMIIGVSILFFTALPALSQMGGPDKDRMGKWSASDMMQQGKNMRDVAGMQGMGFMHSNKNMFGHYVTLELDEQTGEITNYGINGTEIFDSVKISNFRLGNSRVMGALTRITDVDGSTTIQIHDNAAAVINIISSDAYSINFDLSDGVTATEENGMVKIQAGDVTVYIIYSSAAGAFKVSAGSGMVSINAPADSALVVRAHPVNTPGLGAMNRLLASEIAQNRVGAEVCLGMNGSISVVNYSQHMRVQMQSMTRDRIRLRINSTDPTGKILTFNLDNTSLNMQERARLRIFFDGAPLTCIDDAEKFFNATNTTCWMSIQSKDRAQLMIHVKEFSEHIVEIAVESTGEPAQTAATATPAAPLSGGIAALAILLSVRLIRYRQRQL